MLEEKKTKTKKAQRQSTVSHIICEPIINVHVGWLCYVCRTYVWTWDVVVACVVVVVALWRTWIGIRVCVEHMQSGLCSALVLASVTCLYKGSCCCSARARGWYDDEGRNWRLRFILHLSLVECTRVVASWIQYSPAFLISQTCYLVSCESWSLPSNRSDLSINQSIDSFTPWITKRSSVRWHKTSENKWHFNRETN